MLSFLVSTVVLLRAEDAVKASQVLEAAAQPGGALDSVLSAAGMSIETGPEQVSYTCSERQSLDCQLSEWDWVCGAADEDNSCWANRSATILFPAGACGEACGANFQSTVVPCGALPASCMPEDHEVDEEESEEGDKVEPSRPWGGDVQQQSVDAAQAEDSGSNTFMYIGIGAAAVVVIVAVILGTVLVMRRRRRSSTTNRNMLSIGEDPAWDSEDEHGHPNSI